MVDTETRRGIRREHDVTVVNAVDHIRGSDAYVYPTLDGGWTYDGDFTGPGLVHETELEAWAALVLDLCTELHAREDGR